MTEFAKEPRWAHGDAEEKPRPVRFVHHDGASYEMTEAEWYERLATIEFGKRGLCLRDDGTPTGSLWRLPESEEEIQLRLERIEPVTRKQARKEGWEG